MFGNCQNLESLDLRFNTQSITDASSLCACCYKLESYHDTFNTPNLQNMEATFASCRKLKELDIGH